MELHNRDDLTVFVGNLDQKVTEELLYELFLQAGPLKSVRIPSTENRNSRQIKFGFVTFKHIVSVKYAIELLNGTKMFNSPLRLSPKQKKNQTNNLRQEENSYCLSSPYPRANNGQSDHHQNAIGYTPQPNEYRSEAIQPPQFLNPSYQHNRSLDFQTTSTPRELRHSRSINLAEHRSSVHLSASHSSSRRNGTGIDRHNSPRHRNHSPYSELKRSRSHHNCRHEDRRHEDAEYNKNHHHHSGDSRHVISRNRHSGYSPYERSRSYRR